MIPQALTICLWLHLALGAASGVRAAPVQEAVPPAAPSDPDHEATTVARLDALLPPLFPAPASIPELMRDLPGNTLNGLWDPRWRRLRLQAHLAQRDHETRAEARSHLRALRERPETSHAALSQGLLRFAELLWAHGDVVESGKLTAEALVVELAADRDSGSFAARPRSTLVITQLARARWLRRVGAYQEALDRLDQARAILESAHERDALLESYLLDEIGATHLDRGDFAAAQDQLDRALALRSSLNDDPIDHLPTLERLAIAGLALERARFTAGWEPTATTGRKNDHGKAARQAGLQPVSGELIDRLTRIATLTADSDRDSDLLDRAWALSVLAAVSPERWGEPFATVAAAADRLVYAFAPRAVSKLRVDHVSSWSRFHQHTPISAGGDLTRAPFSFLLDAEIARDRAQTLLRSGDLETSGEELRQVADTFANNLGPHHLETTLARAELAYYEWRSVGHLAEIAADLEQAAHRIATDLGARSVPAALLVADLAAVRAQVGSYREATRLAQRSRSTLQAQLAPESATLSRTLPTIAWALRESGAFAEVEPTLLATPVDESLSVCRALHLNRNLLLADLRLREGDLGAAKELMKAEIDRCTVRGALGKNLRPLAKTLAHDYVRPSKVPRHAVGLDHFYGHQARTAQNASLWTGMAVATILLAEKEEEEEKAEEKERDDAAGAVDYEDEGYAKLRDQCVERDNEDNKNNFLCSSFYVEEEDDDDDEEAWLWVAGFLHDELRDRPRIAPVIDPSREADFYHVVGAVLRDAGLLPEAAALYRGAIAGMTSSPESLAPHPRLAGIHQDLADVLWDASAEAPGRSKRQKLEKTENLQFAREAAERSADILHGFLRDSIAVLPERQALRLIQNRPRPETVLFSGLLYASDAKDPWLEAAWRWALRMRSLVLDELAARHQLAHDAGDLRTAESWAAFLRARERLAALWVRGPQAGYPLWPELDAARDARDRAEQALARASAAYTATRRVQEASAADVAAALPPRSALVEYLKVATRRPAERDPVERYVALTLQGDGSDGFADLGPADDIEELVGAWLSWLRQTYPGDSGGPRPELADTPGAELRERVWDPVMATLSDVDFVFVALDGALHQIQFAALPAAPEGYLVEQDAAVHVLSTGRDLLRLAERGEPGAHGMLALANPDFDAEPSPPPAAIGAPIYRGSQAQCADLRRLRWEALPASQREVEEIASLYRGHGEAAVLTGAEASEERLKTQAAGKRHLHVATHGFFLNAECSTPDGSSRGIGGLAAEAEAVPHGEQVASPSVRDVAAENPLLLSGLVLAGAHAASAEPDDGEDGIVTAEELAALDLRGVEVAALSACDTGLGAVAVGEGVFGLRRALEIAGARTVLMSLWPVPDEAAQRWMAAFYRHTLEGEPVQAASRAASRASLEAVRAQGLSEHPYLWAGFVAAGDWK